MTKARRASSPKYYYFFFSCHRSFFTGTSLEQTVIPTAQVSSFRLQYLPNYVWYIKSITTSYIESIEYFPGTTSKLFLEPLVTMMVTLIVTGIILYIRLHIRFISIHRLLYLISFPLPFARHFCLRILPNLWFVRVCVPFNCRFSSKGFAYWVMKMFTNKCFITYSLFVKMEHPGVRWPIVPSCWLHKWHLPYIYSFKIYS